MVSSNLYLESFTDATSHAGTNKVKVGKATDTESDCVIFTG